MSREPLSVLLVDDEALVLDVIEAEVQSLGHTVVGRATDGRRAIEMAARLDPRVVLMDIAMPEMDGIEAARYFARHDPRPVVLLTAHDDPRYLDQATLAGVGAYLVKPPVRSEISRALAIAVARFRDWSELRHANLALQTALFEVRRLGGVLPICSCCKRIRDEQGDWQSPEVYLGERTDAEFTHGLCEACVEKLYPDEG